VSKNECSFGFSILATLTATAIPSRVWKRAGWWMNRPTHVPFDAIRNYFPDINQLLKKVETAGIEPSWLAWEARIFYQ
jgi:hypothetical protein